MSQRYTEISDKLINFINDQKLYFVGIAAADSRVNISPKGMDSLRVIDKNRIAWLNVTAKVIHKNEKDWNGLYPLFNPAVGARQIFDAIN